MNREQKLKAHFEQRSVNKTEFERQVRAKGFRFSRVSLNNVLAGRTPLTKKFWNKINSVLKWEE